MTHTGLVLRTQIDDSNPTLQENYDLVLLPKPDPDIRPNMGLPDTMSWLGAEVRWGTLAVDSPPARLFPCVGNESPQGPFHKGWGREALKFFTSSHTGGCGGTFKYGITHSVIPNTSYHHWAVIGTETWNGNISLSGDVVVFPGATLTINPGTIIEFTPGSDRHQFSKEGINSSDDLIEIFVYGTLTTESPLIVTETAADSILFQRNDPGGSGAAWGGIRIMEGGSVDLDHTTIRDTPPPPPPTGLIAQAGTGQATLRWDAYPVDADIMKWQYRLKPEGVGWRDWQTMPNSGPLTAEHTVTGLIGGETSTFLVRAVNSTGAGSASAVSVDLSPISSSLVKPTHTPTLTARAGDGEVTLRWDEPNAIQCTWQYQQTSGFVAQPTVWNDIPDSKTFTTEHTVGDLTNGQTYVFKVRAVNDYGQGPESAAVSVTPTAGGHRVPPQLTTMLSVAVPVTPPEQPVRRPGQLDIRWAAVSATPAVNGYTLRYQSKLDLGVATSPWSDWCILPDAIAAGTTSYTHTGLSGNTLYRYQVRATNAQGHGAWSAAFPEAGLKPNSPPESPARRPSAPQNLMAAAANESVTLTWQAPANSGGATISGYRYRYRATESTRWSPSAEGAPLGQTTRRTVVESLTNGTPYTFEVWAVNRIGNGKAASVTATPAGVPDPPEVTATPLDGTVALTILLTADNGSKVTHLDWLNSHLDGVKLDNRWSGVSGFADHHYPRLFTEGYTHRWPGLQNGHEYRFEVQVRNRQGASASVSAAATPQAASPVSVSFDSATYEASEGGAAATVGVRLSETANRTLSIPITITAADHAQRDYVVGGLTAGALWFAAGERSLSFTLTAKEDADRDDETVALSFGSLPARVVADSTMRQATVTLRDNDNPPGTVSLSSSSPQVGTQLTATLTDPSGGIAGTTWQWQRRSSPTASWTSATGTSAQPLPWISTYTPLAGDGGDQLRATVGYTDADGANQQAESSATEAVRAPTSTTQLPTPTGLTDTLTDHDSTRLNWNAVTGAGSYQARYRIQGSTDRWTTVTTLHTFRDISGLDAGTQYEWAVRAVADDPDETDSDWGPSSFTTDPPPGRKTPPTSQTEPGLPRNFAADPGSPLTPGSIDLDWDAPTSGGTPTRYRVEYRFSSGSWLLGAMPTRTNASLVLSRAGALYQFRVRAENSVGNSGWVETTGTTSQQAQPPETESAYRLHTSGTTAPSFSASASGVPSGWSSSSRTPNPHERYEWRISRTRPTGGSWSNWGSATVVSTYTERQTAYRLHTSGTTAPSFSASASGVPSGWSSSSRTPNPHERYEWRISRTRPTGGSWSNWGSATVVSTYTERQTAYRLHTSGTTAPSFSASASGVPSGWSSSSRTPNPHERYEWRISRTRPTGGSWSNWGSATVVSTYTERQTAYRLHTSGTTAPSFSASASGVPSGWSSSSRTPNPHERYEWRISRTRPTGGSWSNWGSATVVSTYTERQTAYRLHTSGTTAPSFSASASGVPSGWSSSSRTPNPHERYEWRISRTRPTGGSWSNWGSATVVSTYTAGQTTYRWNNSGTTFPAAIIGLDAESLTIKVKRRLVIAPGGPSSFADASSFGTGTMAGRIGMPARRPKSAS